MPATPSTMFAKQVALTATIVARFNVC